MPAPRRPAAPLAEILLVVLLAAAIVGVGWRLVGDEPFARQSVVWVANVAMLVAIRVMLGRRGEGWSGIGLARRFVAGRAWIRTALTALVVLVVALAAFVLGGALAAGLASGPEGADLSGYDWLRGNLPMLLLALAAVWVVSSFGEEVVYRGFLMTRLAEMGGGGRRAWVVAALVGGLVFGLAHFDWGIVGVVQTTLMGWALAAAWLAAKRNLWALVLAHAAIDTALLVQLYLGPPAG